MKKQTILKALNLVMFIDLLVIIVALLFYKFIPSPWKGSEFLTESHEVAGGIFFFLVVLHIVYNFRWVKSTYLQKKDKK